MWWLARGEDGLPADLDWLSPAEAVRVARLRYPKRRTEYLVARWTAKHAVLAVAGSPAGRDGLSRVDIRNAPTGAPYVLVDGVDAGLSVSLTDRAGWAVCLVARGTAPIGCDLELAEPRSPGFVRDFLTGPERSYVTGQPDEASRHVAANLIWSAKESALKVLRTGLRRDTRSVEVSLGPAVPGPDAGCATAEGAGWAPLSVRCAEGPVLAGWWRLDGRFLLTVAGTGAVPAPVALAGERVLADAVPTHSWLGRPPLF